ncbi:MAG: putative bifunctional diguanylate cyclase/phosphodiesterase [Vicinamibacterales bacterium]
MSTTLRMPSDGGRDGMAPMAPAATWSWRVDSDRVAYSAGWHALLGEPAVDDVRSLHFWLGRVHPDDVTALMRALDRHVGGDTAEFNAEHRVRTQGGGFRWVVARAVVSRDGSGRPTLLTGTLAPAVEPDTVDPLAGLPGVAALRAHVARLLQGARRDPATRFAILLVDLDRFAAMNDLVGHAVGDTLLSEAFRRVARCLREGDVVARPGAAAGGTDGTLPPLGGDECAVVLSPLADLRDAVRVASRIHDAMAAPFPVAGQRLFTSVSIGVAGNSATHDSADDVLRDAYSALVRARTHGPSETQLFDDAAKAGAPEYMEFADDLAAALTGHQFEWWYQPCVDLQDGSIVRAEALVRWRHPSRGLLRPNIFVPLLDQTGTIVAVGWEGLSASCAALAAWRRAHAAAHGVRVSINLLARQFLQPDLVARLDAATAAAGLDHGDLELEITELEAMAHYEQAVAVTRALRDAEYKVALDDFGLGLAGTEHIRGLGVHTLKIDRAYIGGNQQQGGSSAIVQFAVELAAILGIDVVAEGVETPTELEALKTLGCPLAQGFLFSRPITADEMLALLQRSDASAAGTAWWAGAQPATARRRRDSDVEVPTR